MLHEFHLRFPFRVWNQSGADKDTYLKLLTDVAQKTYKVQYWQNDHLFYIKQNKWNKPRVMRIIANRNCFGSLITVIIQFWLTANIPLSLNVDSVTVLILFDMFWLDCLFFHKANVILFNVLYYHKLTGRVRDSQISLVFP